VGTDRIVNFQGETLSMLAPDAPLILIEGEHDNSNQTYTSTAPPFVRGGRFHLIDTPSSPSAKPCAPTGVSPRRPIPPRQDPYRTSRSVC